MPADLPHDALMEQTSNAGRKPALAAGNGDQENP
jgi:hypothetical protein